MAAGDDLDAVRSIAQVLEPFDSKDRERIIRWVREKLGMHVLVASAPISGETLPPGASPVPLSAGPQPTGPRDIKSLVAEKQPKSDLQFAAVVAYYHHFIAPEGEQRDSISAGDLLDACRKVDWPRPKNVSQTLRNAFHSGLLDRAGERGRFRLNSVGENLVAMTLPQQTVMQETASRKTRKLRTPKQKGESRNTRKATKQKRATRAGQLLDP
jgi:hypothetical protein